MKRIKENKLYPIVEGWLKRRQHCFKTAINKGLAYSRIDVVGVKDVGGDLSGEIETISVEVKAGNKPFATACGQASGYKVYANRVYLADLRDGSFSLDQISIAGHLGVGLIQIRNRTCNEVLTSPYYKPITKFNLLLLENLALGKCQICSAYFGIGNIYSSLTRENLQKAIEQGKGFMFWNREVAERKHRTGIRKTTDGATHERRFICPDCVYHFLSQLVSDENKAR